MHLEETKGLNCVSISTPLFTSMSNVLPSIISASGPVSVTCSSPTLGWTWLCVTLEYIYLSPVAFRWETNPQVPSSLGGPSEPVGLGKVRAWPRYPTMWLGWWMWALECSQWPTDNTEVIRRLGSMVWGCRPATNSCELRVLGIGSEYITKSHSWNLSPYLRAFTRQFCRINK